MTEGAPQANPDYYPLARLHRASDGYMSFHRKGADGRFENLCSIRADSLRQMFPTFAEELERDSYVSINAMYRPGHGRSRVNPDLPSAHRKAADVRYLNACWVDVDCHNVGLTWSNAVAGLLELQDQGALPPASVLVRSGRGVWPIWIVRGEQDGTLGERALAHHKQLWVTIQRHLSGVLQDLGADSGAGDLARVVRTPGSVNTKAGEGGEVVRYLIQADAKGNGYTYSLRELANRLGISEPAPPPTLHPSREATLFPGVDTRQSRDRSRKPVTPKSRRALKGWQAVGQNRVDNLTVLAAMRRGLHEGVRNHALLILAGGLYALGYQGPDLRQALEEFNRLHMRPPLDPCEITGAFNGARRYPRRKNAHLANLLRVTEEEASCLSGWPHAGAPGNTTVPATRRADRAARRREIIAATIKQRGGVPPLRALAAVLTDEGAEASLATIRADLKRMGVENPRQWRRSGSQLPLPLDNYES